MKKNSTTVMLLTVIFVCCTLIRQTCSQTPFEINKRLKVIGKHLCNAQDYPIRLRGMSTHGLQWFSECMTDKSFKLLAETWGADIVRLSMYVHEDGYLTDPEYYKKLIDGYVDQVLENGMYCLLDWHMLQPGDPNADIDAAKEYFEYMSKKHGQKGHVIYEICNEPNGKTVTWSVIKQYANQIIPIIRANDSLSVIIVGTPNWALNLMDVVGDELPYENILYTLHFYAADHKDTIRNILKQAVSNNLPVFVTEFGTQESSGDGPNDFTSSQTWLDLLAQYKISWCNWNFSDDFRSGAVWKVGTCGSGNWSDSNLKEAGEWIKARINDPPDDFINTYIKNHPVQSNAFSNTMVLFPNPFKKSISISFPQLPAGNKKISVAVYSSSGKLVYTHTASSTQGAITWNGVSNNGQEIKTGLYFVKATIDNNTTHIRSIIHYGD
jgi:endoglucanase